VNIATWEMLHVSSSIGNKFNSTSGRDTKVMHKSGSTTTSKFGYIDIHLHPKILCPLFEI